MRAYETMFIVRPDLDEEGSDSVIRKFISLIENNGGSVTAVDKWGKRRLAYEIEGFREGSYAIVHFTAEPKVAHELDRVLKITDDVIRHMVIREGV